MTFSDTDQRLHAVELAAHIFAEHAALQVRQNGFARHRGVRSTKTASDQHQHDDARDDAVDGEGHETRAPEPSP